MQYAIVPCRGGRFQALRRRLIRRMRSRPARQTDRWTDRQMDRQRQVWARGTWTVRSNATFVAGDLPWVREHRGVVGIAWRGGDQRRPRSLRRTQYFWFSPTLSMTASKNDRFLRCWRSDVACAVGAFQELIGGDGDGSPCTRSSGADGSQTNKQYIACPGLHPLSSSSCECVRCRGGNSIFRFSKLPRSAPIQKAMPVRGEELRNLVTLPSLLSKGKVQHALHGTKLGSLLPEQGLDLNLGKVHLRELAAAPIARGTDVTAFTLRWPRLSAAFSCAKKCVPALATNSRLLLCQPSPVNVH